jgi:hypothetical protein
MRHRHYKGTNSTTMLQRYYLNLNATRALAPSPVQRGALIYLYVCMYVCMYVCVYVCIHVCMYVYTYVYMCIRLNVAMYVCIIRVYIYTNIE